MTTPTKVQVKLYAEQNTKESLESYIPTFHRWIQKSVLDEMVFDVADYTHVPKGTGVLLVGHACDYAIDEGEGRPGVLYSRKRDLPAGAELVTDALGRALKAAALIDGDAEVHGPKTFGKKEVLVRFPDRLHVKNDEAGLEAVRPLIEAALKKHLPEGSFKLSREGEPREPLTVRAKA